ncbi:MAG: GAF domain-containing protein [Elusimicrobia bacterium]|nr:GAF domain-containing protein [Candidatus Obscuribacterium magneticum]
MSRDLLRLSNSKELLETAFKHLAAYYQSPILLLTPDREDKLMIQAGEAAGFGWSDHEQGVAHWVFSHHQTAGATTDTLAGAKGCYVPLHGIHETVGVLGIIPPKERSLEEPDELRLLEAFASQIGSALESIQVAAEAGRAEAQVETERLRNMILTSFSNDLGKPIEDISREIRALSEEKLSPPQKDILRKVDNKVSQLQKLMSELPQILDVEGKIESDKK